MLGVDRIPGHPASIDALAALSPDIVATGSEDGMIRVIQVLPHKFCEPMCLSQLTKVGVIASHEEYPIERIKVDRNNKWLGSVSHDDCVKLTDIEDLFEDSEDEDEDMDTDEKKEDKKSGLKEMTNPPAEESGFFDDL